MKNYTMYITGYSKTGSSTVAKTLVTKVGIFDNSEETYTPDEIRIYPEMKPKGMMFKLSLISEDTGMAYYGNSEFPINSKEKTSEEALANQKEGK